MSTFQMFNIYLSNSEEGFNVKTSFLKEKMNSHRNRFLAINNEQKEIMLLPVVINRTEFKFTNLKRKNNKLFILEK